MDKFAKDEKEMLRTRFVVDEAKETESSSPASNVPAQHNEKAIEKEESLSPEMLKKLLIESESDFVEPEIAAADNTNLLAEKDQAAGKILGQGIFLFIAICIGAMVPFIFLSASLLIYLAVMLFMSKWAATTMDRAQKLTSPEQSNRLLKRICSISPMVTIVSAAAIFAVVRIFDEYFHFSNITTIENLLNLAALGSLGLFAIAYRAPFRLDFLVSAQA
jgi:uncharacterized membrane protein